ncbi:probable serine/threonine-protein kinase PIX7 [Oryza brachyantha]|uniref:probable serine/threonine-protein kinase PIX7 n=1 Tax=Oryza brachyantha TaxID=4533 RepID=UPI001ADA3F9B|nr:probable serine/threonine-protein kinase PIX7 [Oryza brachyantha]
MGIGRSVPAQRRGGSEGSRRMLGCWGLLTTSSSPSPSPSPPRSQSQLETTVYGGRIYHDKPFRPEEAFSGSISPTLVASEFTLMQFTYHDLMHATENFRRENFLGVGGFGRVHKGWINANGTPAKPGNGLPVAVKTLSCDGLQGHDEWVAEIHYLRNLRHPHLVKLFGFCMEGDQRQLVYEFMSHGSLERHLFRNRTAPLPWSIRVKILLGAAKGLAFLHEEIESPVIFRDFKTSNILLDEDYNAKLSDFGLARDGPVGDKTHVSTRVLGTYGYTAPEYVMTGHLTWMSDVYSFGVVVLEVLTGRKATERMRMREQKNLVDWGRENGRDRDRFHRLIDPSLGSIFSISGAQMLGRLACACTNRDPKTRPPMSTVVHTLDTVLSLQDMATDTALYRTMLADRAVNASSS